MEKELLIGDAGARPAATVPDHIFGSWEGQLLHSLEVLLLADSYVSGVGKVFFASGCYVLVKQPCFSLFDDFYVQEYCSSTAGCNTGSLISLGACLSIYFYS